MDKILNSVWTTVILFIIVVLGIIFYMYPQDTSKNSIENFIETFGDVQSDTLSIFSFPNYFSEEILQDFKNRENVAIKIQFYENNEELLDSLLSGNVYDIIVPSDHLVTHLIETGIIKPLMKNLIPNYANLDIRFRELEYDYGNQYSIPYFWGAVGLTYDQNHVMNLPLTWASLLDTVQVAHLRNRIAILDDARISLGIVLIAKGKDPNTINEDKIRNATDYLIRLVPYIGRIQSEDLEHPLVEGDVYVAMNWSGSAARVASLKSDIRFILPAEGSIFFVDNLVVPVNAKSKSLAYKFIDYLLEPRVAAKLTNQNYYPNPITASRRYIDRIILKGPAYINPLLSSNIHVIEDLGEVDSIYVREWRRFKEHHANTSRESTQTQRERGRILLF